MAIKNYSTTASNNTSVNSSSIAEGMAPSAINNSMREIVKDIRDGFNDKEWFLLGDGDATTTFTRASTTSVTVASDITSSYHVGRRVKVIGSNTGTIYGKIASSSYSSPNTTITFTFDSGNIPSSDTTVDVYVGSTFSNPATPVIDEDDLSSNSAILPPSQQSVKAYVDSGTATLSGKSIDLTNNTLTGTTAEFNTALSDNDFATIAGTETLTNKTLTSPVLNTAISGTAFKDEDDLSSDSATAVASQQSIKAYVDSGSTTLSNKTIDSANNTLTVDLSEATVTGTLSEFNTAVSDATLVSTTGTETLTNKTLTAPTVSSLTLSDSSIVFEGSTADDFETTLTAIDPTADRTVSIPNATTTLAGTDTTDTFTNKTISGNTNTLTDVPNSALTNSSVSFGGVSVSLGSSDATPAFDLTDATNYPTSSLTGTITNAQLAGSIAGTKLLDDAITTAKIIDDAVTTAKIVDDAVTIGKIADGVIVTNAEQSAHTVDDNTFFTTSASDARYFRQDSSETISSGDTWSASDSYVATTSAIDNRIVDLVDEVGGFVAIANETSFPTTNPDINDSTGTIVSISAIGTTRTPSSGTVTIANGSGSNTVTITGCGSTVLTAGYGVLVETTSTLHTYTFHRLVPKATEVTNVSSISSDITAVANDETDIGVVSGLSTDIQALADIEDGTSATNAISNVGNNISDVTTVATNLTGTDTIGTVASNLNGTNTIGSVGGSITNVNTVASNISSVNTTASNISGVNSFAERYRVGSSDPSSSLDQGDLFYNTTDTALKYYNGTAWASITAGITNVVEDVTPELGGDLSLNSNDITGTGNINITGTVTATNLSGAGAGVTSINASNISSGTLSNDRLSSIPNTALANSSITINGSSVALGGSITTAGDIESVTAGTGLSGGGASGAVTLDLDLNELTTSTSNADGDFFAVVDSLGNQKKLTKANINISEFNNDAGYLTSETDSQTLSFSSPNLTISNGNSVDISGITSGYLQNLSEDSTPQLGGSLDLNSNDITGTGNINITGSATVTGNLSVTGTVDGRDVATDGTKLDGIESGATADQTDAEIKTAYENNSNTNAFTDAEKTKLSGIESGATADMSASEILTAIKTVDGAGSGLDADTLDGISSGSFLRSDTADSVGGTLSFGDNAKAQFGASNDLQIYHNGSNSIIKESGTGDLRISGTNVYITNGADNEAKAYFGDNGPVELYYDNSKKFETTSAGATVTGTLTATAFSGDGSALTGVGAGISWQSTPKTANFTASANEGYYVNTTSSSVTMTLPSSPSVNDEIGVIDFSGTFNTNKLIIDPNSLKIEGGTGSKQCTVNRAGIVFIYTGTTQGWVIKTSNSANVIEGLAYNISYLVIAGGGSATSGDCGGGGAGGYRNSYASETSGRNSSTETPITLSGGVNITVTVGAGSSGWGNGSDSSISGSGFTTITSTGGGKGAGSAPANSGGCGGGCADTARGGVAGSGTTGQGFGGGVGASDFSSYTSAGGGGGAGQVGQNSSGNTGGNGGNGLASSITGSSVYRAGGGGGEGGNTPSGGLGGGGNEGSSGTANTGGGGGGGAVTNGGSGVVILRFPTASYSGTTTGSPTVTTSGSDTILTFTGSGSYTT